MSCDSDLGIIQTFDTVRLGQSHDGATTTSSHLNITLLML